MAMLQGYLTSFSSCRSSIQAKQLRRQALNSGDIGKMRQFVLHG